MLARPPSPSSARWCPRSAAPSTPVVVAARHQHARAGQRVGDLERQPRSVLRVVDARSACRRCTRAARACGPGAAPRTGRPARRIGASRSASARSSSAQRLGRDSLRVLGLEHDPPARAGRREPSMRHDHVADLAGGALEVADGVAVVALGVGDARRSPRTPPPRSRGPWPCRGRAPRPARAASPSRRAAPAAPAGARRSGRASRGGSRPAARRTGSGRPAPPSGTRPGGCWGPRPTAGGPGPRAAACWPRRRAP